MKILSATEAINPAFARVRQVLFKPFRFGRTWKLAATCYLAIMGDPNRVGMTFMMAFAFIFFLPGSVKAWMFIVSLLLCAISFFFFWIGSHLEFAVFDMASVCAQFVAPSWRRCKPVLWSWIKTKLIFAAGLAVLAGLPMTLAVKHLIPIFAQTQGTTPPPAFLFQFLGIFALIYFILGLAMLASSLMNDFLLPSFALEGISIVGSWRRFAALLVAEPGQFFAFTALKAMLAIAGFIVVYIATLVCMIPVFILFFLFTLLTNSTLHGPASQLLMIPVMLMIQVSMMYIMFLGYGALNLLLRSYAVYFLGGRYPMLGDLLDQSTPSPTLPSYLPPGYVVPLPPPSGPAV